MLPFPNNVTSFQEVIKHSRAQTSGGVKFCRLWIRLLAYPWQNKTYQKWSICLAFQLDTSQKFRIFCDTGKMQILSIFESSLSERSHIHAEKRIRPLCTNKVGHFNITCLRVTDYMAWNQSVRSITVLKSWENSFLTVMT